MVDATIGVEKRVAEELLDGLRSSTSGGVEIGNQAIGVYHPMPFVAQHLGDRGLATGEAASEPDQQALAQGLRPWRLREARKVLTKSWATVSRPTPPGTGVMADALGATRW